MDGPAWRDEDAGVALAGLHLLAVPALSKVRTVVVPTATMRRPWAFARLMAAAVWGVTE